MRVLIVRHAEAAPGQPDELRQLTPEGEKHARALGERLRKDGFAPEAVVTSPRIRALQTATALGFGEPEVDDRLAPGASPADMRAAAEGRGDPVVLVGHQPDCGRAVLELVGVEVPFPPAGCHEIEL
jgi:phosphohistidine phosphatase